MKRKTLLALGVAGVIGCSGASATTYLCELDPADVSFKACGEISSHTTASVQSSVDVVVAPEPSVVTYYTVEPPTRDLTVTEVWVPVEPAGVTYYYSFDSVY